MVAPPSFLPFPIFPLPPQVFLSQEVQPWEGGEENEGEDSKELRLKAKKDVEDKARNILMRALSRRKRRRKASETDFDSSTSASSLFDFDSEESQSSDGSDSREDEGEEKEEKVEKQEEKDMTPDYPYEGSTSNADEVANKLRSPYVEPAILAFFCFVFVFFDFLVFFF